VLVVGTVLLGGVGYANAEGAFVVQTLALAWAILLRDPDRRWRAMVTTAAIIGGLVLLTTRSAAGLATLAIVTVAAIVSRAAVDRPQRLLAVFGGLLLLAAAVLAQLAMVRFGAPSLVAAALSQRRLDLWTDAVALVREQPLLGHGPGTFGLLSPTAFANPDTRPAHSVLLETAAELGAVGVVLLVAVVTWGYARLVTSPSRAALVGVAAWTAFWLHALVDYVADYAAVTVMVGLVLGYAVGGPGASQQIRRARYHPA
jgi:O-antigen ligase